MSTVISGDTGVSQVQDGVIQTTDIAAGAVTPEKMSQKLTLGTAQNTTSGTSVDFTGIPSWSKRITVMFSGVSTNGTSLLVQIGNLGGIETTNYLGSGTVSSGTSTGNTISATGFYFNMQGATKTASGLLTINLLSSVTNTWAAFGVVSSSDAGQTCIASGSKSLSNTLDRIRITTVNGTDTFDAGTINIMYEG